MNIRDEFHKILLSITIDNIQDDSSKRERLAPLSNWLLHNTPTSLFRFLSDKERNINAIDNDEVYGSLPTTFNDPFECMPCFDLDTIQKNLESIYNKDLIISFFKAVKSGYQLPQMKLASSETMEIITSIMSNPLFYDSLEDHYPRLISAFSVWLNNSLPSTTEDFFKLFVQLEQQQYVTCFSENRDATLMWAHYANSHKGFCVEYNWKDSMLSNDKGGIIKNQILLAPVKYTAERYDATAMIYTLLENSLSDSLGLKNTPYLRDTLLGTKLLLTKSSDWEYEKEWRMIYSDANLCPETDYRVQVKEKPTAIYIGAKMDEDNAERLQSICNKKNIPCYKMIMSYSSKSFSLLPILYSDYKKYKTENNNEH